jgi:hypothetical protein
MFLHYKSALGFNALFFYGRALTVHERTLMIAYSKKEYESIDPVELPPEITDGAIIIALFLDGVISTVLVPTPLVTWAFVISGGNVPPPPLE